MSYNYIDLYGKSYGNVFLPSGDLKIDSAMSGTLALRELADIYTMPKFTVECTKNNIKPLCAVVFALKTPEDCLVDVVEIICYPEDDDGCEELKFLCTRHRHGLISYEDFCKFSNHLQVGLSTIYDEKVLLIIDNIIEFVFVPDFVLVDNCVTSLRCWGNAQNILEKKKIMICLGDFDSQYSDEKLLEICEDFGDKAYEYLIENPRKIADKISGDIKFDVEFLEEYRHRLSLANRSDYVKWYRNWDIEY